ncbi:hypothetical protein ROHU_003822 [Labeo rohita]|uniref:Uncharacterized protein n=1 Tax=Labeo rohita TaxID=84645 RepID=A0A498NT53_LABRO|nr:hypothetical protein ROHU_003822 [Labeo rohita]
MGIFFFIFVIFALVAVAVCAPELKLATVGEDVTISFQTAGLERATRVRLTFKGEHEEKARVIVQFCAHGEQCDVVKTPGVLLRVEQGTLILQHVSFNNSGLYEAKIITGKVVSEIKATLVVKKPAFSSTKTPLLTSIKNPPNSSEHQWPYALLILPVIALGVVVFLFWRKKCKRKCDPAADDEEARETPCRLQMIILAWFFIGSLSTAGTYVSVANKGCGDLETHIVTAKHRDAVRGGEGSSKLTDFFVQPERLFPSEPPQTSISKPPQSSISELSNPSERQRLFVAISPLLFIVVVLYVFCK